MVAILGALDTKGEESKYLKRWIEQYGQPCILVDTGVQGDAIVPADISREQVATAAGTALPQVRASKDRNTSITVMGRGAAAIVAELHKAGRLCGVIGVGGSAGTAVAAAAMQALPVGLPKLIVSTLASGNTRAYVGVKDITMTYSVVDISGLNRFSEAILSNAAAAIAGMARHYTEARPQPNGSKPLIAATVFGVTTPCVMHAKAYLEQKGYEVVVFHATGSGGRAMEALVDDGFVDGVLDVTTTEWADELVGGVLTAGPHRLEAMGRCGIPHVVAPGALDMVSYGPRETVPPSRTGRRFYQHNPQVTLMRTTAEENGTLGRIIADKLNDSTGPVELFIPLAGFSALDREGMPFVDSEADEAFRRSVRSSLRRGIQVHELPLHINDEEFALAMARRLDEMVRRHRTG